ncbi:MAG: hypothetical protein DRO40_01565 [Thermoprotei archaeon]|nr:MAG: hypothetical protein DRO40_01565 [Thermoprotei archaeon]
MEKGVRILFDKVIFLARKGFVKGYVFIEGDTVKNVGEETPLSYSFSELVYDFEYKAVITHGYSIAIAPSYYPFRGFKSLSHFDLTVFSRDEIKEFIKASFYELYLNGVTLPLIYNDPETDLVIDVARIINIPIAIIGETDHLENYINIIDNKTIYGIAIGDKIEDAVSVSRQDVCTIENLSHDCRILYLDKIFNLHATLYAITSKLGSLHRVVKLLTEPYRILNIDNGFVDKGSRADIVLYNAGKIPKAPIIDTSPEIVIARSYHPDIVLVNGDVAIEYGESYILNPEEISRKIKVQQ